MRYIFIFLWFYSVSFINAQSASFDPDIIIKSSIDTTNVKIGEEIIYTIDIESKNKYNILTLTTQLLNPQIFQKNIH